MYSRTDIVGFFGRWRPAVCTAVVVSTAMLGCGASGDQVLGTISVDESPIHSDAGSLDSNAPCTANLSRAKAIGGDLALHITIDRSSAMVDQRGGDKWDALVSGLTRFLHSDAASAISVGLEYFPFTGNDMCSHCQARDCNCLMACGCSCDMHNDPKMCQRGACDQNSYRRADVDIAPVLQNGAALTSSLFAQMPTGPTTLRPALQGALAYATAFQAQHVDDHVVELVIAGGPPATDCSPSGVADCADVAAASNIRTSVVAFDYDGNTLDPIATRGGGKFFQIDSRRDDVSMRFAQIVSDLRNESRCDYDVSSVPAADLATVNLDILRPVADAGGSTMLTRPSHLQNRDACGTVAFGWYYDRPDSPTRIVVCDNGCNLIRQPPEATVSIQVGCSSPVTP